MGERVGSAAIAASTKDQVDVTGVATPADATLRECKQVAIGGLDHRRNAEGVVSRVASSVNRGVIGDRWR